MTFDEAWAYTSTISSETAFSEQEGRALFTTVLTGLPHASIIVEVGCEYGRSTSLLAQAAKADQHRLILIEPAPKPELLAMLNHIGVFYTLHAMKTEHVSDDLLPLVLNLVHIDGDHSARALQIDCARLLPKLARGGIACFHDYGRPSLPDVEQVVDRYTASEEIWQRIGIFGTLRVLRKRI